AASLARARDWEGERRRVESLARLTKSLAEQNWVNESWETQVRILLADEDVETRSRVERLLSEEYEVTAVPDSEAALSALRSGAFDVVLADGKLGHRDCFGLLSAIRSDTRISAMPVIVLSVRAEQESWAECLEHGADDYLLRPFSASELRTRVAA